MTMCSICKENYAVFITKIINGRQIQEGLPFLRKEAGHQPINS